MNEKVGLSFTELLKPVFPEINKLGDPVSEPSLEVLSVYEGELVARLAFRDTDKVATNAVPVVKEVALETEADPAD